MSQYCQLVENLNQLQKINSSLKESIEKYDSGEIFNVLQQIKKLIEENDLLQRIITKKYEQACNELYFTNDSESESDITLVHTPNNTPQSVYMSPQLPTVENVENTNLFIDFSKMFSF